METVYLNGRFHPKDEARISPDDRGFLFADGIYEVVRWYGKDFFDMQSHMNRLHRSLRETSIEWSDIGSFPEIAKTLIKMNDLESTPSMVYLEVTRGAARRTHYFPSPAVIPTVYAYAFEFKPDNDAKRNGIRVLLKEDIRWSRCDIKSVALLANTMSFNEAHTNGFKECIFARNGIITEGSHSNIMFIMNGTLRTHPESNYILSGISRKNVLRIAREQNIPVVEEPVPETGLQNLSEAFITNTSGEVVPVIEIGGVRVGNGSPGPVTMLLQAKFGDQCKQLSH